MTKISQEESPRTTTDFFWEISAVSLQDVAGKVTFPRFRENSSEVFSKPPLEENAARLHQLRRQIRATTKTHRFNSPLHLQTPRWAPASFSLPRRFVFFIYFISLCPCPFFLFLSHFSVRTGFSTRRRLFSSSAPLPRKPFLRPPPFIPPFSQMLHRRWKNQLINPRDEWRSSRDIFAGIIRFRTLLPKQKHVAAAPKEKQTDGGNLLLSSTPSSPEPSTSSHKFKPTASESSANSLLDPQHNRKNILGFTVAETDRQTFPNINSTLQEKKERENSGLETFNFLKLKYSEKERRMQKKRPFHTSLTSPISFTSLVFLIKINNTEFCVECIPEGISLGCVGTKVIQFCYSQII